MPVQLLKDSIEGIDIYLLDQILKNRYQAKTKIVDAGCGNGRNLKWFYNSGFTIYGIDQKLDNIEYCKNTYSNQKNHFKQAVVENIPFETNYFNHVICNAVLHFAKDLSRFLEMFEELLRILKPEGSLFIRMASNFGMENQVEYLNNGNYKLPDGSTRFLLTTEILEYIQNKFNFTLLEDVKTTIVQNKRCMTTLVLKKS
ncbi:class I SAM-dependent methyltransferase [Lutibacter citreus]|uniref:class I SAM-dependent methyltransferase n=1 Tax=Lutibacter citreus TaxID=2138210 RepID=UPI000DBE07E2|nr:class I SAM-dependent methyltransferase [Lutibacter citreus]